MGLFWSLSVSRSRSLLKVCELAVICARPRTRAPPSPLNKEREKKELYTILVN